MNDKNDIIFVNRCLEESPKAKKEELKHSRLNFFSQAQRCNSMSGHKKRKTLDSSLDESFQEVLNVVPDPTAFTINDSVKMLTSLCRNLEKVVEANNNTKKEIKDITERMKRQVDTLNTESVKEWFKTHKYFKPEIPVYDVDTQVNLKANMKDNETQTNTWTINKDTIVLEVVENFEDWQNIKDKKFPEEIFINTETKIGSPLNTKDIVTKIVIVEPTDKEMSQSIQKIYKDKYPALVTPTNKEIQILEIETIVTIDGQKSNIKEKIIKTEYDGSEKGIWNKLVKIKDNTKEDEWIALHHVNCMDLDMFQKMVETIFHKTTTRAVIYTTKGKTLENKKPAITHKPERSTYAMILDKKGEDAVKIMKTIKQKLMNTEEAKIIQSIRETKNKKLIIITNRDSEKFRNLHQKINNDVPEIQITQLGEKRNKENIFIRGLEPDANKEDVITALAAKIENFKQKEITVSDLRPNQNGTKSITITLDKEDAEMITESELKIGLVTCSTERDLNIKRCYRCWALDHIAAKCTGPDRRNSCLKCGKEGHRAKECSEENFCVLCQEVGHQTSKGKCKTLRKEMSRTRRQQSKTVETESTKQTNGQETPKVPTG